MTLNNVDSYSLKCRLKSMIAARRNSWLISCVADGAERYLRAYNNEQNWHARFNGEARAFQAIASTVQGEVLDVGANEGQWASMALDTIEANHLHCFEVIPQAFDKLKTRLGPGTKATLNHFGLGSRAASIDFYFYPDSSDRSSHYSLNDGFRKEKIKVSVISGDEYISRRGIRKIAFLKLDVEGMEMDVLQGFSSCLQAGIIQAIQFEHGPAHALARRLLKDFLELLEGYSYAVFKIFPKSFLRVDYDPERDESFVGQNLLAVHSQILARLPKAT
jgi:FkbM family methyltransferase